MSASTVHQAFGRRASFSATWDWATSPGWVDEWCDELLKLYDQFAQPDGEPAAAALFVQPLSAGNWLAVVRTAPSGDAASLHALVLRAEDYADLGADPFWLADRLPAIAARDLPTLEVKWGRVPRRTAEGLRPLIEPPRAALLLGGAQVLVDGGRLCLKRDGPDEQLVRDIWALLPYGTRAEVYPSTYAFSTELNLHVRVVPESVAVPAGHNDEDAAQDYPQSRYEHNLEVAIRNDDQPELDRLFARRGAGQAMRLAAVILVLMMLLSLAMRFL